MDKNALEEIGFTKGESKVYFALVELGERSIGAIAQKAKVTPAKVYGILDKLAEKGLVSKIIKSGTNYFEAAHPSKIIEFLNEKNKKIEEEKKKIRELIPFIEERRKLSKEVSKASVYQGYEGMRTLYNDMLATLSPKKEDFIGFTLGEEEYKFKEAEYFFQEYDTKRRNAGVKLKLLGSESQKKFMKEIVKVDTNIDIRFLPYQMPTGVIIFGNKVATLLWKEVPMAFVTESRQVADSYKKFFWDMWKIGKK